MIRTTHRVSLYACLASTVVCCGVILSARSLDTKAFIGGLYGSMLAVIATGSATVVTYRD